MIVHNVKTGDWKENCFIVEGSESEALIIDPGDNFDDLTTFIETHHLKPIAIVNTHGHFDHVGAVNQIKEKYKIKFYLHRKETALLKRANLYKAAFIGKGNIPIPEVDVFMDETTLALEIGSFHLKIHQTPGHTNGGVCIELEGSLFTGDTLLSTNLIPKKLPEENRPLLRKTYDYLSTLNPELMIYPGHGQPTPLGKQIHHLIGNWKDSND
jgi:hydroxyacylglutathione hydrolase